MQLRETVERGLCFPRTRVRPVADGMGERDGDYASLLACVSRVYACPACTRPKIERPALSFCLDFYGPGPDMGDAAEP